jgi:hypothetical protein
MTQRLQVLPSVIAAAFARDDVIHLLTGDAAIVARVQAERIAAQRIRSQEHPREALPAPAVASTRRALARRVVRLAGRRLRSMSWRSRRHHDSRVAAIVGRLSEGRSSRWKYAYSNNTRKRMAQSAFSHRTHDNALPSPWSRIDRYFVSRTPPQDGQRGRCTTTVARRLLRLRGRGTFTCSRSAPLTARHCGR